MHFGVIEIVVIALLVFLLFGYKKLPTAMKSLKDSLEIFKKEQGVSFRDLKVYLCRIHGIPSKKIAEKISSVTANNVDQIRYRVGRLLRRYGPDCYARALRRAS